MAQEFNSQQPVDDTSPGEHNRTVNVSDDGEGDSDSVRSDHSDQEHDDAEYHDHSSSQEQDNGNDSDCTEIGSEERESETAIELMLADGKRRKDLCAQKRLDKEAKAKALKIKPAPIVRFFLKLSNQYPLTGTKAREQKE